VATGHKPGGVNTTPLPFGVGKGVVPFGPEDLNDYEIGWKSTLLDGRLRTQLDGFYTDYRNFQLTYAGQGGQAQAGGMSIIQNVPGVTVIYGVEAEGQGAFGPLSFNFGGAYVHSRLSSRAGILGGPTGPENVGGAEQPFAPHWTLNAGAQYAYPLGNGMTLTPRIDYGYVSSQCALPFQGPLDAQFNRLRPINNVAAQVTLDAGSGLTITVYGTNLLDEQYFGLAPGFTNIPNSPATSPPTLRYIRNAAAPRQYGIRIAKSF
jgi:iron complex outermembrane receptor protein